MEIIIIIIIIIIIGLTAEQIWRASLLTPPKDALLNIFEPSPVPSWKLKSHESLCRSLVAIHVRPPLQKGFVGEGSLNTNHQPEILNHKSPSTVIVNHCSKLV